MVMRLFIFLLLLPDDYSVEAVNTDLEPDHLVEPALTLSSCVIFSKLLNLSVL